MGELIIIGKREKYDKDNFFRFDVTSGNIVDDFRNSLSPFFLGPIECYDGLLSQVMENAWQYSKVYKDMADESNNPTEEYFKWRDEGWNNPIANRHPKGREIPLYSLWKDEQGQYEKLGYIDARKKIYIPMYAKAALKAHRGLQMIKDLLRYNNVALADFDGYNHKKLGMSYREVINCPTRKMGHAFVLGMLAEGVLYQDEQGDLKYNEELLNKK